MTANTPATQSRQTSLNGLTLPLTIEHFQSLSTRQKNGLIAEQVMQWKLYEWEEECTSLTPGAEWQNGTDYYALPCRLWAPENMEDALEDDGEALTDWAKSYGSTNWVEDIGAAMRLLEKMAEYHPTVYASTPTEAVPWTWYCRVFHAGNKTDKTICWHGATDFEELPKAIALMCLEAIAVIDNRPLSQTPDIEELVLQAAMQGPLADIPGNRVNSRYDYHSSTWIIEATALTQDGEEKDSWQAQYRDGHTCFMLCKQSYKRVKTLL